MPDAEHQKEVVHGFQPDNDECDITIKFHGLFVWEPSDLEEIPTN